MRRKTQLFLGLLLILAADPALHAAPAEPGNPPDAPRADAFPIATPANDGTGDLSATYRNLYLQFAGDDRAAAIDRTVAFERATLAAEPKRGFDKLSAADSALFVEIAKAQPRALLPLSVFYRDLARRYSSEHDFGLLMRAHRATEEILQRLAATPGAETPDVLTAAYQSYALDLLDVHAASRAAEMLESAVAVVPDDVPANIALSFLLQLEGRYAAAAQRLDRALATDPANREAQLRRAVLRARVAESKASKELEELATGPENDWIAIVAWQERARLLIGKAKYREAIAWLEKAIDRFPAERSFRIALSFCQSRAERREAAERSADLALERSAATETGARKQFTRPPIDLLGLRREQANVAAESRWPELRMALLTPATGPDSVQ